MKKGGTFHDRSVYRFDGWQCRKQGLVYITQMQHRSLSYDTDNVISVLLNTSNALRQIADTNIRTGTYVKHFGTSEADTQQNIGWIQRVTMMLQ